MQADKPGQSSRFPLPSAAKRAPKTRTTSAAKSKAAAVVRQATYVPTTAEAAAKLLRDAGAPEPWRQPELLQDLADAVNNTAGLREPISVLPEVKLRQRAQKAVSELRNLLPQLVLLSLVNAGKQTLLGAALESSEAHRKRHVDQAVKELALYTALIDVDTPRSRLFPLDGGAMVHWHLPAAMLWLIYRQLVGRASTSRHGPANRFVRLALRQAGWREPEAEAVEQALNRSSLTTTRR